jgi:hypothetical protein
MEDLRIADYVEIVPVAIATQSNNSRVLQRPGGLVLARTSSRDNSARQDPLELVDCEDLTPLAERR